jgi:hypothetical protein
MGVTIAAEGERLLLLLRVRDGGGAARGPAPRHPHLLGGEGAQGQLRGLFSGPGNDIFNSPSKCLYLLVLLTHPSPPPLH